MSYPTPESFLRSYLSYCERQKRRVCKDVTTMVLGSRTNAQICPHWGWISRIKHPVAPVFFFFL